MAQKTEIHQSMINAAHTLAREEGPHAVTIRRICRDLDISETAAYRTIDGHQGLLDDVVESLTYDLLEEVKAQLNGVDDSASYIERLQAFCRAFIRYGIDENNLLRTVFSHVSTQPDCPIMIEAVLSEHYGNGGRDDLKRMGTTLWAQVIGLTHTMCLGHLSYLPEKEKFSIAYHAISSTMAGIAADLDGSADTKAADHMDSTLAEDVKEDVDADVEANVTDD